VRYVGATVGVWSVDGDGNYVGGGDASSIRLQASLTGTVEQVILDQSLAELAGGGELPAGAYRVAECSPNSLTLTSGAVGGSASMVFQRTG